MFGVDLKMPITIAIAEDNSLALQTCLSKLNPYPEFKVLLTAYNGEELIKNIQQHPIDIVLMDIQMPGIGGIETTRTLKMLHPQIKVLMLTTFDDDENIFKAILAGASGYLLKEETADILHQSVIETLSGGAAMSAGIALKVLNLLRNPVLHDKQTQLQDFGLTKRELELLSQLKNGLSYEKIADNLYISYGTVRKHIENIYRKLQVNNKTNALEKATQNRLI
ncbi:response regulator transcription factor [Pedobacter cryophilus]|uniref:Response regulator transcription factor n=1 Tax=Pedobacter cryophilus TaxID=2571271 RepID=A0A4U1BTG3_9SPHI|nr:response regulator transcription factor [Pedobacter cryophilus]TKB95147.1 response regulator transcription factor [Pedobacter cryophilus]